MDNFYQSFLFFPMPVVLVSTLTDDGKTTCGPYSLIAPFYVAGKDSQRLCEVGRREQCKGH